MKHIQCALRRPLNDSIVNMMEADDIRLLIVSSAEVHALHQSLKCISLEMELQVVATRTPGNVIGLLGCTAFSGFLLGTYNRDWNLLYPQETDNTHRMF